jgi:hypothetical protein|mmetsp:Transcript_101977/g.172815  ORF Transcript_101977/g.172815 Transcript_101977/m.172815 type:complete len:83 (-) Transcript_101977:1164-1412(-)
MDSNSLELQSFPGVEVFAIPTNKHARRGDKAKQQAEVDGSLQERLSVSKFLFFLAHHGILQSMRPPLFLFKNSHRINHQTKR